jgi:hypothetical protein
LPTLLEEFKSITAALNDAGIEYAVCGGWAMAIHGFPRGTIDIDLLIREVDLPRVIRIARDNGFDIQGLPLHFEIEIRRISKIDPESNELVTLDLLLVTDENQHDLWTNRVRLEWKEGETTVVSRESLIAMKRVAGRRQDLADIEKLEEVTDES